MTRLSVFAAGLMLVVSPGIAAPPSSSLIDTGQRLAESACSQCHRVSANGPAGWTDAPALSDIANRPGTTNASLRKVVMSPQKDMLHTGRSEADAAALAAYIMSLRAKAP
jgi:mono/diheme cytochrome c family protein